MTGALDEKANFTQLNRRFRPVLMAYFLRRLRNHSEAEDMTQEVFLRLAGHDEVEMQSPEAYIFQIAANLLHDRGRREKVRSEYRAGVSMIEGRGVDPLDPLRIASDREALSILRKGVAEFPERTRTIFLLCRLENMDRKIVAEAFGVSMSTIDRELARALALLTSRIRGEA